MGDEIYNEDLLRALANDPKKRELVSRLSPEEKQQFLISDENSLKKMVWLFSVTEDLISFYIDMLQCNVCFLQDSKGEEDKPASLEDAILFSSNDGGLCLHLFDSLDDVRNYVNNLQGVGVPLDGLTVHTDKFVNVLRLVYEADAVDQILFGFNYMDPKFNFYIESLEFPAAIYEKIGLGEL